MRGGKRSTSWKPGASANPGGKPKRPVTIEERKAIADVKALAKERSEEAIKTLVDVVGNQKAPPAARVAAAEAILNRGWGRPTQPVQAEVSIFERLTDVECDTLIAALESSLEDEAGLAGSSSGTTHEVVRQSIY
jgi:hypothetical protein